MQNEDDYAVIYTYSRQQAIDDGVLIDVTSCAKEAGFKLHTCIGDNLYNQYIIPTKEMEDAGQSIQGRLWDVFVMLRLTIRHHKDESRILFDVLFLMASGRMEQVTILAVVGPGDTLEPVLTICLPEDE